MKKNPGICEGLIRIKLYLSRLPEIRGENKNSQSVLIPIREEIGICLKFRLKKLPKKAFLLHLSRATRSATLWIDNAVFFTNSKAP